MSSRASRKRRRLLAIAAGVAVSAALLVLTFRKVSLEGLGDELARVRWRFLVLAFALKGLQFILFASRTRVLIARLGHYRFGSLVKSHLLAFAVNNVIPLRAGEVAKVGYLARVGGVKIASVVAVVLTERLTEMFVLCLILAAVLPAAVVDVPIGVSFYLILGVSFGAIGGALFISRRPALFVALTVRLSRLGGRRVAAWFERRAETFADGLSGLQRISGVIAVVAFTCGFWALVFVNTYLAALAVGVELPWHGPVVLVAFIAFGLVVPSTPGNIGTYHFFAAAGMTALGVGVVQATSFAVVSHALAVVPYTVLAIPILWTDYARSGRGAAAGADDAKQGTLGDDLEQRDGGRDRVVEVDGDAVGEEPED